MYLFYTLIPVALLAFWMIHFSLARHLYVSSQIDTILMKVACAKSLLAAKPADLSCSAVLHAELTVLEKELRTVLQSKNVVFRGRAYEKVRTHWTQIERSLMSGGIVVM